MGRHGGHRTLEQERRRTVLFNVVLVLAVLAAVVGVVFTIVTAR